jgi:hypothetical protein
MRIIICPSDHSLTAFHLRLARRPRRAIICPGMLWRTSSTRSPRSPPTGFIRPCQPRLIDRPPAGPEWRHEVKHDGYRLCHVVGGLVAKEHDENQLPRISVPSGDHSPGDLALSPVHAQLSRRRKFARGARNCNFVRNNPTAQAQPRSSSQPTPPRTTPSTSNAISHQLISPRATHRGDDHVA